MQIFDCGEWGGGMGWGVGTLNSHIVQGSTVFQNGYFSSPPAGGMKGSFSSLHVENLMELSEIKLRKVWESLKSRPPGVLISQARPNPVSNN